MSTEPTNEAIRIACAEAMGWTNLKMPQQFRDKWWDGYPIGTPPHEKGSEVFNILPNYTEDDKAARELRMSLTEEDGLRFIQELDKIVNNPKELVEYATRDVLQILNASPRDQSIAFLKVKGVKL